jgi:hypothetical protein
MQRSTSALLFTTLARVVGSDILKADWAVREEGRNRAKRRGKIMWKLENNLFTSTKPLYLNFS